MSDLSTPLSGVCYVFFTHGLNSKKRCVKEKNVFVFLISFSFVQYFTHLSEEVAYVKSSEGKKKKESRFFFYERSGSTVVTQSRCYSSSYISKKKKPHPFF